MEASHKRSSMSQELMKLALKELQNARDHIYLLPENEQPLTEEQILNRINAAITVLHQEVYGDANDTSQKRAGQQEPEALRLADALDAEFVQGRISNSTGRESAVELRRLALKPWVGLTDEEVNELVARFKRYAYVLLREVEAKLKEKNT